MCNFIAEYKGNISGASPAECGNYSEPNLSMSKFYFRAIFPNSTITSALNISFKVLNLIGTFIAEVFTRKE